MKSIILIIASLIFTYIGLFLSIAYIEYKITPGHEGIQASKPPSTDGKSLVRLFDDVNGKDITSCGYWQKVDWLSDSLHTQFSIWMACLRLIVIWIVSFWFEYLKTYSRNMGKIKLFLFAALFLLGCGFTFVFTNLPDAYALPCDAPALYTITAFIPNFGVAILYIAGILFGYFANRFLKETINNETQTA